MTGAFQRPGGVSWWASIDKAVIGLPLTTATAAMPVPIVSASQQDTAPAMAAFPVMLTPGIHLDYPVLPPVMAAIAGMPMPVITFGPGAPVMTATAAMPTPVITLGVTPPVMTAIAAMPTVGVHLDYPVLPPAFMATAAMPAPTVSAGVTITPPVMAATAAMPTPAIGCPGVPSPVMTATAAMPTPTVKVSNPGHTYGKRFRGARR